MKILYFKALAILIFFAAGFFAEHNVVGFEYKPAVETRFADVTMYSSVETCGACTMANGKKAHAGAAACPRDIELGARFFFEGDEYTCEDRTARKYDGRFDLFAGYGKEAYKQAKEFGIARGYRIELAN